MLNCIYMIINLQIKSQILFLHHEHHKGHNFFCHGRLLIMPNRSLVFLIVGSEIVMIPLFWTLPKSGSQKKLVEDIYVAVKTIL